MKSFTQIIEESYCIKAMLMGGQITPTEAEVMMERNQFHLDHWKVITARTTGYTGLGYLNN